MPQEFDPYRKWLGIPPHDQPPNHYRLLGIAAFEDDPDVISNAADRQMAHVRTFQTGRYADLSQQLLTELSSAKLCLLDPKRRAAYDEQLQSELEETIKPSNGAPVVPGPRAASGPSVSAPATDPMMPAPPPAPEPQVAAPPEIAPPEVAPPQSAPPVSPAKEAKTVSTAVTAVAKKAKTSQSIPVSGVPRAAQASNRARARRRSSQTMLLWVAGSIGGLVLLAALVAISQMGKSGGREDEGRTSTPSRVQPNHSSRRDTRSSHMPPGAGHRNGGHSAARQKEKQRRQEFRRAVADARLALADRRRDDAAAKLALADQLKSAPAEGSEVEQLRTLLDFNEKFWQQVDLGVKKLKPGDEVGAGSPLSQFVSRKRSEIVLSTDDGPQQPQPVAELEAGQLISIAKRGAADDDPMQRLHTAAFLAVDGGGRSIEQLDFARRVYAEAAALGVKSEHLATELSIDANLPKVAANDTVNPPDDNALPAPGSGSDPIGLPDPDKPDPDDPDPDSGLPQLKIPGPDDPGETGPKVSTKRPVPPTSELGEARRELARQWRTELQAARTDDEKRALVAKLISKAAAERDDAMRFALWEEVRDLTLQMSNPAAMLASIDEQAKDFDIDVLEEKALYLGKCVTQATQVATYGEISTNAVELEKEAFDQRRFDVALKLAKVYLRAAKLAGEPMYQRLAQRDVDILQEYVDEQAKAEKAEGILQERPDDPTACLAVGRFRAFYQGDWNSGLPLLAKSNYPDFSVLAERELAQDKSPKQLLTLASEWNAVSRRYTGMANLFIAMHVRDLLTTALPGLAGDDKTSAQDQVQTINDLLADSPFKQFK